MRVECRKRAVRAPIPGSNWLAEDLGDSFGGLWIRVQAVARAIELQRIAAVEMVQQIDTRDPASTAIVAYRPLTLVDLSNRPAGKLIRSRK